jgi:uncharacterized spore protein YtfJ
MSTTTASTATTEVPHRRADDLLGAIAEKVGGRFTAASIFGPPVEHEGVTVVPVSSVRFALGGGGGTGEGQEGEGGGGAGVGSALGYIELKNGRSRFVPVVHPARMLAIVCATVLTGILMAARERSRR